MSTAIRVLRSRFTAAISAALLAGCLASVGCQQKMAGQPSYRPLEPCGFFGDGRAARPLVAGTVARGHLQTDVAFYSGQKTRPRPIAEGELKGRDENRDFVDNFPIAIDERLIRHGRDRYLIYCVVCHDPLGTGQGKIVERGYTRPPSFHIPRLRQAPVGRLFAVITEGYGSMPSYAAQVSPEARWA